jgi:hypothetical protein
MAARGEYFFLITSLSHLERSERLRSVHKGHWDCHYASRSDGLTVAVGFSPRLRRNRFASR